MTSKQIEKYNMPVCWQTSFNLGKNKAELNEVCLKGTRLTTHAQLSLVKPNKA